MIFIALSKAVKQFSKISKTDFELSQSNYYFYFWRIPDNCKMDDSANYNFLAEDTLFSQFTQLAENVRRTLPPGSEGALQISNQVHRLKACTAEGPEKILGTWRAREVPIFSQQAIHKLISANSAWTKEINEGRKKQKESIKMDIT